MKYVGTVSDFALSKASLLLYPVGLSSKITEAFWVWSLLIPPGIGHLEGADGGRTRFIDKNLPFFASRPLQGASLQHSSWDAITINTQTETFSRSLFTVLFILLKASSSPLFKMLTEPNWTGYFSPPLLSLSRGAGRLRLRLRSPPRIRHKADGSGC